MLFFKRIARKLSGKTLWYPQLITRGKPAESEELAERLSYMSTVTKGDVYAVLANLPSVMADILSSGRAVHINGLGSFYLNCTSRGRGAESPEQVDSSRIKGLRVVFLPERHRGNGRRMIRPLVPQGIEIIDWERPNTTKG